EVLDEEGEALRLELEERLRAYAHVKALGAWLGAREAEQALLWGRPAGALPPVEEVPLEDLSVHLLERAVRRLCEEQLRARPRSSRSAAGGCSSSRRSRPRAPSSRSARSATPLAASRSSRSAVATAWSRAPSSSPGSCGSRARGRSSVCRDPRSRRWRSSPTSSRCRAPRWKRSAG